MVQILVDHGADVHEPSVILSMVISFTQRSDLPIIESNLEMVCRNGYSKIADYLLENFRWKETQLKKAYSQTKKKNIQAML
jgi:hypothetical protein